MELTREQFFEDVKSKQFFDFFDGGFFAGEGTWKSAITVEMVARYGITNVKARNFLLDLSNDMLVKLEQTNDGQGGRDTWLSLTDRAIAVYGDKVEVKQRKAKTDLRQAAKADISSARSRSHENCDHPTSGPEGKKARAQCRRTSNQ